MRLTTYQSWLAGFSLIMGLAATANATEIAGIKLDETIQLANTELKLNGAGIRYKAIFKVYVAGLYLRDKKTTTHDVVTAEGPRRVTIVMLRDLSSEDFSRGFMQGIQKNTEKADKAKLTSQFLRFGELFASVPELKKGDVMTNDWIPGVGTVVALNGKKMGDPYPDILFYNTLLRIWLGDSPVDSGLKKAMLGEAESRGLFH